MLRRILAIADKEWTESLQNNLVLITVFALPLIISVVPLSILYAVNHERVAIRELNLDDLPVSARDYDPFNRIEEEDIALQIFFGRQLSSIYLILPLAVPMTIATYSIVGEKRERSLEPLLVTPIRTWELLLGKCLAAAIPGILCTWFGYGIFLIGVSLVAISGQVVEEVMTPAWWLSGLVVAPLLTMTATIISLMISARVSDPRAAEQLGLLMVLPILGLLGVQVAGILYWNTALIIVIVLGIMLLNPVLFWVAWVLFERETILTRWNV